MASDGIAVEHKPEATIATLDANLHTIDEAALTDSFREGLLGAAKNATTSRMLVNLSHVEFFGSSFIELLFRCWNRLEGDHRKLVLVGMNDNCKEVIDIARLSQLWDMDDDVDTALDRL